RSQPGFARSEARARWIKLVACRNSSSEAGRRRQARPTRSAARGSALLPKAFEQLLSGRGGTPPRPARNGSTLRTRPRVPGPAGPFPAICARGYGPSPTGEVAEGYFGVPGALASISDSERWPATACPVLRHTPSWPRDSGLSWRLLAEPDTPMGWDYATSRLA